MNSTDSKEALATAVTAARMAGELMRRHLHLAKKISSSEHHDIKLELDVRCQKTIERILRRSYPGTSVLGEEGTLGDPHANTRWVVDPIDGTVNFACGIPHACVSIALQERPKPSRRNDLQDSGHQTVVGVIYDPFCDELWTAYRGGAARLNGRRIAVSKRRKLNESVVSLGFAKRKDTLEQMLPMLNEVVRRVRKVRLMGAAALAMAYVACGRFDAYAETGIRLWDIAAGGLILECAGGDYWHQAMPGDFTYAVMASNGLVRAQLSRLFPVIDLQ